MQNEYYYATIFYTFAINEEKMTFIIIMKVHNSNIKMFLKELYKRGVRPQVLCFILPCIAYFCVIGVVKNMMTHPTITDILLIIYTCTFLLHIIVSFFLLRQRRFFLFSFAVIGVFAYLLGAFLLGMALQSAPTGFAEDHPIPKGLIYNTPKGQDEDIDAEVTPSDTTTYLQIRNSFQGGIYEYSFYYPQLPAGTIFLRCYEVTENLPLSEERIIEESCQHTNGTNHFSCLVSKKQFTIYEGDWNEYYAARIEVWFKAPNGHERKLLEKIYAVEGWMR